MALSWLFVMKEIEIDNHDEIRRLVTFDEEKYKK